MDSEEFRKFGKFAVDYLANYLDTIRLKQVLPDVEPGYLQHRLPSETPNLGEDWIRIFKDLDEHIVPGLTHWHSPSFHAYMPTANSFAGIIGDLMLSAIGGISTTWDSNPASVELELKMLDWLAKMMDLPQHFLNSSDGLGGGSIQNAASESTLLALLTSKNKIIETRITEKDAHKLVAYTSNQSNSSVERAGLLASMTMRMLPTDPRGSLRGETLLEAIRKDKENQLIPCCVIATFGTTGTCSFDDVEEIGKICQDESIWLHVDAAYAGTALICPEFRDLMKGIDKVDSFCFNPHKWMKVNSDCSAMWFKDTTHVEKLNSKKELNPNGIPNIHLWQIPNSKRFRALKLWFVLRINGIEGLQKHVRHQVNLAVYFQELVKSDGRFEISTANLGVVTFRIKGDNERTRMLLDRIRNEKKLFLMPYHHQEQLVIRFVVCSSFTEKSDVENSWNIIRTHADFLEKFESCVEDYKNDWKQQ